MTDTTDRINELEIKIAHLEQQLSDLNDMVTDQWKQFDSLGSQLNKVDARIETLENSAEDTTPSLLDEKPPHY